MGAASAPDATSLPVGFRDQSLYGTWGGVLSNTSVGGAPSPTWPVPASRRLSLACGAVISTFLYGS